MKLKAVHIELFFLAIFVITFLWNGVALIYEHKLNHNFPHGYMHRDTFEFSTMAEYIKEEGNFRNFPYYMADGYTDTIANYPPLLMQVAALFSLVSGLKVFDAIMLLMFLFWMCGALAMYLVIRKFSINAAIISLPFFLTRFMRWRPFWGFLQGEWISLLALVFLVYFILAFSYIKEKRFYTIAGLFLSGIIFTHLTDFSGGVIFLVVFFIAQLIRDRKIDFDVVKKLFFASVFALAISSYSLVIQYLAGAQRSVVASLFRFKWVLEGPYVIRMSDFSFFVVFIYAGVIFSLSSLLFKKNNYAAVVGLSLLLSGNSNLIGLGRTAEARNIFPIGLAVLFSIGVYYTGKIFVKKWKIVHSVLVSIAIFLAVIMLTDNKISPPETIMDSYHWESLMWIKHNTPKDARIYFFYADPYYHYYNGNYKASHRVGYNVELEDYIKSAQQGIIKDVYLSVNMGTALDFKLPYWKGFLKVGFRPEASMRFVNKSICDMDYYVFDKVTTRKGLEPLIGYNLFIKENLLKNSWIKPVWSNAVVDILKNTKPGAECVS